MEALAHDREATKEERDAWVAKEQRQADDLARRLAERREASED